VKDLLLKLSVRAQIMMMQDEGQDLVEYALLVSLIAFAAVASMRTLGNDVNSAFNNVGTKLTSATT
jgi:pilus assembly protein Flp/PilA